MHFLHPFEVFLSFVPETSLGYRAWNLAGLLVLVSIFQDLLTGCDLRLYTGKPACRGIHQDILKEWAGMDIYLLLTPHLESLDLGMEGKREKAWQPREIQERGVRTSHLRQNCIYVQGSKCSLTNARLDHQMHEDLLLEALVPSPFLPFFISGLHILSGDDEVSFGFLHSQQWTCVSVKRQIWL